MLYTDPEKASFVLRYAEEGYDYAKFTTRVRRDVNNWRASIPDRKTTKAWVETLLATGSVHGERGRNKSRGIRTEDAIEEVAGLLRQDREMREQAMADYAHFH